MKYIKLTLQYCKNNWLGLLLYSIVPSILLTIFINPVSIVNYLMREDLFNNNYSWFKIFLSLVNLNQTPHYSGFEFFGVIAFFVISAILMSSAVGRIQNVMRYGKKVYNGTTGFIRRVNDNLLSCVKSIFAFIVLLVAYHFLVALIIFTFAKVNSAALAYTLISLSLIFLITLFFVIVILSLALLPYMTMRGFSYFQALKYSVITISKKFWTIMLSVVVPIIVLLLPAVIVSLLNISENVRDIFMYIFILFFYLSVICYIIPLFYVMFFDIEEIERADLIKNKRWEVPIDES